MINEKEFFHWSVFARLIDWALGKCVDIRKHHSDARCSYIINESVAIYIKTSSIRNGPWTFTFTKEHQDDIQSLMDQYGYFFLILVCNDDGIVSLDFTDLKKVLDYDHLDTEWIKITRKKWEKYAVRWHDGELDHKIWEADFPRNLLKVIV